MVRSRARARVRHFWSFYRTYTESALHTATAASLTIFGLLVFVDPWFVAVAIGSYVFPPVALYALRGQEGPDRTGESPDKRRIPDAEARREPDRATGGQIERGRSADRRAAGTSPANESAETTRVAGDGDTDSDSDDGDTDSDSDDGDTDSDSDDGDTDSDSDG